jgi:pimeloyl-ACP methyl ester carboxylesterase
VEKRSFDYIRRQATEVLPELLDWLRIRRPVLFGHSEGAIISLVYAGAHAHAVGAIIVESPVVEVEAATVEGMRNAAEAYRTTDFKERLARHHRDADAVFHAFVDPWMAEGESAAGFDDQLRDIRCPVLLLQGDRDEYSTAKQMDILARHLPSARTVILRDCGHTPHREKPDVVLQHVAMFVRGIE